jgi:Predicted AAA-ATPase/PD-(D/E)XK nuclease superfamily
MKPRLPLGMSDFRNIINDERYYVDKTLFIKEVMDSGQVLLVTRPRRFGKTLNMSMLRYYYGNDGDYAGLFKGLAIENAGEAYRQKCGKHPVVFMSFKDIKSSNWKDGYNSLLSNIFSSASDFWNIYPKIRKKLKPEAQEILDRFSARQPKRTDFETILKHLCHAFYLHYGASVVLLIDEYDTPVITAHLDGYYDDCVAFMRDFLAGGLKDNPWLEKAVLTGIIRVAKESMFSGLNNFTAWSVMGSGAADKFGFTEPEVRGLLEACGLNGREMDDVRRWYNGYLIGDLEVYNPWSILQYVENIKDGFRPYWVNTSDNRLLQDLFFKNQSAIRDDIDRLLAGEWITKNLSEHLVFADLKTKSEAVWNLLLASGYLKPRNLRYDKTNRNYTGELHIPNIEVEYVYADSISTWLSQQVNTARFDDMVEYLVRGQLIPFENLLYEFLRQVASYHDTAAPNTENFYHALFLGMLTRLGGRYRVVSNREAGFGRYDIALFPLHPTAAQKGVILEIKTPQPARKETLRQALNAAVRQIKQNDYAAAMRAEGVRDVFQVALAVQGKDFLAKEVKSAL